MNWKNNDFYALSESTLDGLDFAFLRQRKTGVQGDYFEFGVFNGYSLWHAQKTANNLSFQDMKFFGFDSFKGLPNLLMPDSEGEFEQGEFACERGMVEFNLLNHGADMNSIFLVEGFFDESLTNNNPYFLKMDKASVILIDCDLYHSARLALEFMKDFLQEGSVILFDDWNCFSSSNEHGERRAFTEFLSKYPQIQTEPLMHFGWHGQGFVLHSTQ